MKSVKTMTSTSETEKNLRDILDELFQSSGLSDTHRRVQLCQNALTLISSEENLPLWAMLKATLGNSLADSPMDSGVDNIEMAIEAYKQALEVLTRDAMPVQWAMTMNNLGTAYKSRIQDNRVNNIEMAIVAYKQALEVLTQETNPVEWAKTKMNLGNAYRNRILFDRADNFEQAISYYEQALEVLTQDVNRVDWARVMMNLGNAYRNRILFDRADNIEQAISYYEQALEVLTQDVNPVDWARTMMNLGIVYSDRTHGNRADNIEQAISYYEQALNVMQCKTGYIEQATTMMNLGTAYFDRIRSNRADNIEQAISYYEQALEVMQRQTVSVEQAITMMNLGIAYSDRILGNRADNIKQAISYYEKALKIQRPELLPNDCRRTARNLGNLYFEEHRWPEAIEKYELAIKAAENLYQASLFRGSREAELAETGDLYHNAAYSMARADRFYEAVGTLERGRARGLSEALARDRADLEGVRAEDPDAYERYQQAAAQLRQLENGRNITSSRSSEEGMPPSLEALRKQASQARADLNDAIARIRRIPGREDFLQEPDWDDVARVVTKSSPLVYLNTTSTGSLALIVYRSGLEGKKIVVDPIWRHRFNEEKLRELLANWFKAYNDQDRNYLPWFKAIENGTRTLWDEIMEPVVRRLRDVVAEEVVLVPTGLLALLPLHAAWTDEAGKRRYALDEIVFSYAPSARSLEHARRIAKATPSEQLVAVDEPKPTKGRPLRHTHQEVTAVAALFDDPKIFRHEDATRVDLLEALPLAEVAHFSCHGGADWEDPNQSGLLMANDETLTVKDLFGLHLKGARLATLSACETGMIGGKLPDEVIALPSAFMRAGFAGVVASLWSVEDKATAKLMEKFYNLWRVEGKEPAQALREAQQWVRDNHKEHPFYWAAFYLTGV